MNEERFWILLSKKYAKEATHDELSEFELLIKQHPEWQYAIQTIEQLWEQQPQYHISGEDAYLLHLNKMRESSIPFEVLPNDLSENTSYAELPQKRSLVKWLAAAAVAASAILCYFLFFDAGAKKANQQEISVAKNINEISTRHGSKTTVHLPDGSVVRLNAGSRLTYNKDFGNEIREVKLSGEGYFEVVKNTERPFIIHTHTVDIKVLGTAFNVKAYPGDKTTETSLIHGKIEVSVKNRPSDVFTLKPNEKLVVENEIGEKPEGNVSKKVLNLPMVAINRVTFSEADNAAEETLWINNKLVIRAETFREMANKMERWYDVVIDIQDEQLEQKEFNAVFEDETVQQALEALSLTTPFKYDIKGKKITIYQ